MASADLSSEVAQHYNALEEKGLEARAESRIFYLRNFNNWVKSMLIGDHLEKMRDEAREKGDRDKKVIVLDLCCGKGGDLLKWKKGRIDHLVCADIADVSLEQCKHRYEEMKERSKQERRPQDQFTAEFIHADCSKVRLRDRYSDPSMSFDMCSCQFSLHYSFASMEQAICMLRNACENLRPGGYFVGTIPNAAQIVRFVEKSGGSSFQNEVVSVRFDKPVHSLPLFGARFEFNLHEVVNCPEYLLHFPLLVEMLKKFDMELVYEKTFPEMVEDLANGRGKDLLARMQGLEAFPNDDDVLLMGLSVDEQYDSIKTKVADIEAAEQERGGSRRPVKAGTLSKSEWEAAAMYLAFAFRKKTT